MCQSSTEEHERRYEGMKNKAKKAVREKVEGGAYRITKLSIWDV